MKPLNQILLAPKTDNIGGDKATAPLDPALNKPAEPVLSPEQELAQLRQQLAEANKKLARAGVNSDIESVVIEKMRAGLSREQAIEVTRRQALYDQAWTESRKIKDPAEAKAALDEGVREALRS